MNLSPARINAMILGTVFCFGTVAIASSTSNVQQTINAGSLAIDIVDSDSGYTTVASPTVVFGALTFGFGCKTGADRGSGTLGTTDEAIYVSNPDAADGGWTASIAGSAATAVWDSAGTDYDFNDATSSGCSDGADADAVSGQMNVDPSVGTLAVGQCASCVVTNVSKGSANSFSQATTDTITVLSGAAGSDDIGDWVLTGVAVKNTIPAEQPAASDYDMNLVLSIVAS